MAARWTDGVWGSHIRREEAEDGVDGDLVPDHLVSELRVGQLAGVFVGPSMAGNLVAFGVHSLFYVLTAVLSGRFEELFFFFFYLNDCWIWC